MPQISSVKYLRSSFFVKPASCEVLLRRTSTRRLTPASFSSVKNWRAVFFVKPIVKIFIFLNETHCGQVSIQNVWKRRFQIGLSWEKRLVKG